MAPPLLPAAETARSRIEEAVQTFSDQKGAPPLFLLSGGIGGGKSTLLAKVAEGARQRGLAPVYITPPELELDAPAHAVVQAGAALRNSGVNGVLDPVFSADATFAAKVDALARAATLRPSMLLVRVPESWTHSRLETPDTASVAAQARDLLRRLLETVAPQCPTVIVQADTGAWPEFARKRAQSLVVEVSSGPKFLQDPGLWRELLPHASRLGERLGPTAKQVAPLTLRLGVALLSLGRPLDDVQLSVRAGFRRTANLMGEELLHRPDLLKALRRLRLVRFPLPLKDMRTLAGSSSLVDDERKVVEQVLLLELADGWILHPRVRQEVTGWVTAADEAGVAVDIAEQELHTQLARYHAQEHGQQWWERGRTGAIAWMEELFHSACAGDRERVLSHACDVSQFLTLGRALSLRHDHPGAAEIFQAALQRAPDNSYASEYLAFNLERSSGANLDVERYYRQALQTEADNPWWNRRYIRCLLERGKPAAAFEAFLEAQEQFESTGRSQNEEWLARHFHMGVAKGFLEAGELARTAQVFAALSSNTLNANSRLRELRNRLMHRQEADSLAGAVFPEHIDFETRWRDGPHTVHSEVERERVAAWFPGRIVRAAPEVVLEFAEPPAGGEQTELMRVVLSDAQFRKQAQLPSEEPLQPGQFIEVLHFIDGTSRIRFQRPGTPLRGSFRAAWPRVPDESENA